MKVEIDIPFLPDFKQPVRGLLEAVFQAHQVCARRQNNSTTAVVNAWLGSERIANGLASAILTIGGPHGPLLKTRDVFEHMEVGQIPDLIKQGIKIPGFGSDFAKGKPDDTWNVVSKLIEDDFPERHRRIVALTETIHSAGKKVYPNAALYTAVAAVEAEVPRGSEDILFILPRIPVWVQICHF